jgi:exonuclease SbcC
MIPVKLTIEGLYSYQSRQVIDFTQLCDARIFGIFGSVGSGKSSILEAITFSIYGRTDRLNLSGDNRTYNMMNLRSSKLFIEFIFCDGRENNEYKAVVTGRRNSKRFEDIPKFDRSSYIKRDGEWSPLDAENALEKVIGLNYDNFKRTVIIPQGKFQEFLQLKDSERTAMMKELFNLDKFELSNKVVSVEKKTFEKLTNLRGKLEQLGEISPEQVDNLQKSYDEADKELKVLMSELELLRTRCNAADKLKEKSQRLNAVTEQLSALNSKKDEMDSKQKSLDEYIQCITIFKEILNRYKGKELEHRNSITEQQKLTELLTVSREKLNSINLQYDKAKADFDNRETLAEKQRELNRLLEARGKQKSVDDNQSRLKKGRDIVEKTEADKLQISKQLEIKRAELTELRKQRKDITVLSEINSWFKDNTQFNKQLDGVEKELKNLNADKEGKEQLYRDRFGNVFPDEVVPERNQFNDYVTVTQKQMSDDQKVIQNQYEHKLVEKELGVLANDLEDGKACPLCGSENHPVKWSADGFDIALKELIDKKNQLTNRIELVSNLRNEVNNIEYSLTEITKGISAKNRQIDEIKSAITDHSAKFIWTDYNRDDAVKVKEDIEKSKRTEEQITQLDKLIETEEKRYRDAEANLDKYRSGLEKIEREVQQLLTERDTLLKDIKVIDADSYIDNQQIEVDNRNFAERYKAIGELYESVTKERDKCVGSISKTEGQLQLLNDNIVKLKRNLDEIDTELKKLLGESNYNSNQEVEDVLNRNTDVKAVQQQIDSYTKTLFSLNAEKRTLSEDLDNNNYNEKEHQELSSQLKERDSIAQQKQRALGELFKELTSLKKDLETNRELVKDITALEKRHENIRLLKGLFKGSGFVNYVSSVHLQQLCVAANERFFKLTNQKLQLELTDDNKFSVRDFMNGGNVRNIKTLSGGQTFQAALSLALALSDNIQRYNGTGHNFFFLDEGFGSLDKKSLAMVFESLKSLRKENRVVGVISHIEEMQQEIGACLIVDNDEETGSSIRYN